MSHRQSNPETNLKLLALVPLWHRIAATFCRYCLRLITTWQQYKETVASQLQKMQNAFALHVEQQATDRKIASRSLTTQQTIKTPFTPQQMRKI